MDASSSSAAFTHLVAGPGPAHGLSITGIRPPARGPAVAQDVPLVIAVPGGTYTSRYFDIPGYSLLDRAAALGIPVVAIDRPGYGGCTPVDAPESIILTNAEVLGQVIDELWGGPAPRRGRPGGPDHGHRPDQRRVDRRDPGALSVNAERESRLR